MAFAVNTCRESCLFGSHLLSYLPSRPSIYPLLASMLYALDIACSLASYWFDHRSNLEVACTFSHFPPCTSRDNNTFVLIEYYSCRTLHIQLVCPVQNGKRPKPSINGRKTNSAVLRLTLATLRSDPSLLRQRMSLNRLAMQPHLLR